MENNFINILQQHLKEKFLPFAANNPWNNKDDLFFAKGIVRLNRLFTTESKRRSKNYFSDPVLRSGYFSYFFPINVMKTFHLLKRNISYLQGKKEIHIIDIGAGPLTLSFGTILALAHAGYLKKDVTLYVTAIEQNKAMVQEGKLFLQKWWQNNNISSQIQIQFITDDARKIKRKIFAGDLVLCGNLLNEFSSRDEQSDFVMSIWRKFSKENTRFFLLEPGSKKVSRDLQAVRDEVLAQTGAAVIAPCLHEKICPLNQGAKSDWCHFSSSWEMPDLIARLDKECGLKKTYLLFSYLILAQVPRELHSPQIFRAISHPLPVQGRKELIGCGSAGRIRVQLWKKDISRSNFEFNDVQRGDIFYVEKIKSAGFSVERTHVVGKNEVIKGNL